MSKKDLIGLKRDMDGHVFRCTVNCPILCDKNFYISTLFLAFRVYKFGHVSFATSSGWNWRCQLWNCSICQSVGTSDVKIC